MIDWLTLKVDAMALGQEQRDRLRSQTGRVVKISPTGEVEWETAARESIRSDSHQVTVCMGGELTVSGSPARVLGTSNVFGSGDIRECAAAMLRFVSVQVGVTLPHLEAWRVTRADVTHNYDLGSLANVRQALLSLRHAEGGRYQLRTAAESVYWSVRSQLRSGKAYAKGPHVEYQHKKGQVELSQDELQLAGRLLRLELSLRSQWWRERSNQQWHTYSEGQLDELHAEYFAPLVGKVEVSDMRSVCDQVIEAAKRLGYTEGKGKAAYAHWLAICDVGLEHVRDLTARATHYRHLKVLREAGLSFSDFQARRVVPFRRSALVLAQPVRCWDELRRIA